MTVNLNFVSVGGADSIALLTLARPEIANAFNVEMMETMRRHLGTIHETPTCRMVILRGAGKNFCAGGDLQWMKDSAELPPRENLAEARRFSEMFKDIYELPVPTMAIVQGACYGGGVGVASACDWILALDDAKFCLTEVKVGVVAAIILPYVSQKIAPGQLRRLVLGARVFPATEAFSLGMVQRVTTKGELDSVVRDEVGQILAGSPDAQRIFKQIHHRASEGPEVFWRGQEAEMVGTLARLRASGSGREGLNAYLEKRSPKWARALADNWTLPEGET